MRLHSQESAMRLHRATHPTARIILAATSDELSKPPRPTALDATLLATIEGLASKQLNLFEGGSHQKRESYPTAKTLPASQSLPMRQPQTVLSTAPPPSVAPTPKLNNKCLITPPQVPPMSQFNIAGKGSLGTAQMPLVPPKASSLQTTVFPQMAVGVGGFPDSSPVRNLSVPVLLPQAAPPPNTAAFPPPMAVFPPPTVAPAFSATTPSMLVSPAPRGAAAAVPKASKETASSMAPSCPAVIAASSTNPSPPVATATPAAGTRPPALDQELLSSLRAMFPMLDHDVITTVLWSTGNADDAVTRLLQMSTASPRMLHFSPVQERAMPTSRATTKKIVVNSGRATVPPFPNERQLTGGCQPDDEAMKVVFRKGRFRSGPRLAPAH